MRTAPSTEQTAKLLSLLRAGQQGWFWFCPQVAPPQPPLLLVPFQKDPDMARLLAMAEQLERPLGARLCMGTVGVQEDGLLQLRSPTASHAFLQALAAWATTQAEAHPGLARLAACQLVQTSRGGAVLATFSDPALWADLQAPPLPGSIADAAAVLAAPPDGPVWFWLAERGPGDQPFLALLPVRRDPDGARFARRVQTFRQRSPAGTQALQGLLRPGPPLTLVVDGDTAGWAAALRTLLRRWGGQHPALRTLEAARMARLSEGAVEHVEKLAAPLLDHQLQRDALAAVLAGQVGVFWLAARGPAGSPLLVIATEREQLKAIVQKIPATGETTRGQVRRRDRAGLTFRARNPAPDFLPTLAAWATREQRAWPELSALAGSRLVVTAGEQREIFEADHLWADLTTGSQP